MKKKISVAILFDIQSDPYKNQSEPLTFREAQLTIYSKTVFTCFCTNFKPTGGKMAVITQLVLSLQTSSVNYPTRWIISKSSNLSRQVYHSRGRKVQYRLCHNLRKGTPSRPKNSQQDFNGNFVVYDVYE